jgi:uncharacterized damage-inducible protein DinB
MNQRIETVFEYHDWANRQFVAAARSLPDAELERELGGSFKTYLKTLRHILFVELLFLGRWQGTEGGTGVRLDTVEEIAAAWERLEEERRVFLYTLGADRLDEEIRYADTRGRAVCVPLWQAVFQCVNHATFHRGQLAEKLRKLGRTPPATDYILFRLDRQGSGVAAS